MKKFVKPTLYSLIFILVSTLFLSLLNYLGVINKNILEIVEIIFISLTFLVNGYKVGKKSSKKGWLNGLEAGGLIVIFLIFLTIILKSNFNFKVIIFYIILLVFSIFGSMIGINKGTIS